MASSACLHVALQHPSSSKLVGRQVALESEQRYVPTELPRDSLRRLSPSNLDLAATRSSRSNMGGGDSCSNVSTTSLQPSASKQQTSSEALDAA